MTSPLKFEEPLSARMGLSCQGWGEVCLASICDSGWPGVRSDRSLIQAVGVTLLDAS